MIWPLFKVVEKMIFLFGGVCLTDLQTNLFVGAIFVGWSDVYPEMTPLSGTKPPGKPCLAWREPDSHAAVQKKYRVGRNPSVVPPYPPKICAPPTNPHKIDLSCKERLLILIFECCRQMMTQGKGCLHKWRYSFVREGLVKYTVW